MFHTIDLHFQNLDHAIAAFLIESEEGPILIESGPYSTFPILEKGITEIGYQVSDVQHVLLTHIHFDHAGAAWAFAKAGAKIYLHPFGAPHMQSPEKLVTSATMIYGDQMDTLWGKMENIPERQLVQVEHDQVLEIGGKKIKALHTPGHAKHHIAWKIDTTIFTGDVAGVKIGNGPVVPPCPPPDINLEDWFNSMKVVLDEEPEQLVLTHFGEVKNPGAHFAALHECIFDWSEFIKDAWKSGMTNEEITPIFMKYVTDKFRQQGLSEKAINQYEAANPSWMSVAGLVRYWKKKLGTH